MVLGRADPCVLRPVSQVASAGDDADDGAADGGGRLVGDRADQLGHRVSHSLSFDHLRPVCFPFTAIAIAFF